jgi:hypothetical protein
LPRRGEKRGGHIERQVALEQDDVALAPVAQRRFGLGDAQRQRAGAGADDAVLAIRQDHQERKVGGVRQARQDQLVEAFEQQMPLDLARLGFIVTQRRTEAHPCAATRGHDGLVQPLAARRPRTVAANQRLTRQRQARHRQPQIEAGIADDDDAAHANPTRHR